MPSFSIRVQLAEPPQGVRDVIAAVRAMAGGDARLAAGITMALQMLTLRIQKDRFTGKGPFPVAERRLGVVKERLRRDLHAEDAVVTDGGYRGRIGSRVEYFGAHELGFSGQVQVKAHTRSRYTTRRGYSVLEQSVRAHSKAMRVAARAPLRAGIEEHSVRILGGQIERTLKGIFEGRGGLG